LTARALGAELFGILMLIKSYVMIVDLLVNFQSGQALVKYGAAALEHRQIDEFKRVLKFGFLLDCTAATLGTLLAVLLAPWVGRWMGWDGETVRLAMLYSVAILSNLSGMPSAVMRLFERFQWYALQDAFASGLKLIAVTAAFFAGAGLKTFLLVWLVSEVAGKLLLLALGWVLLRRQGIKGMLVAPISGIRRQCPGIWNFVWTTNLSSSIRLVTKELDLMLVGGLLGASAAGLFKVDVRR
jgi:O-antigen/teichoic acid export membrane protein